MVRCLNCMNEYDEQFEICPHCGFVRGSVAKEAYHLYPGVLLNGRYKIGTTLGLGGFGITYRAWDTQLERIVAVKEFYPSGMVNRIPGEKTVIIYTGNRENEFKKGKERFLAEAKNMAKFNQQENIVNVLDFFQENNTAYIVMEFLDGISFKQYIARSGGKVDISFGVTVVETVAKALQTIHRHKIIHRDISPDNIFICKNGVIKLIDFGAARFSTGEEEKTLSIILKPGFAPPEQYRNKSRQGAWTDIYALGAVLYRALTGKMPDESVNRVVKDDLVEPKELNPEIPDYLNNSIMRAMALNQELRFQNIDQFLKALQQEKKVLTIDAEIAKRKRFRWIRIAAIGMVLCIGGMACFKVYNNKRKQAYALQADLELWIETSGGEEKKIYEASIDEFNKYYKDIHIEVKEVGAGECEEVLAMGTGVPDIFSSTQMTKEGLETAALQLENFEGDLKAEAYFFQNDIEITNEVKHQIPIGFEIPVLYVNIGMIDTAGDRPIKELVRENVLKGEVSMNPEDKSLYKDLLAEICQEKSVDIQEEEKFYNKTTAILLGTTDDYEAVQKNLTGLYELVWPSQVAGEKTPIYARFSEMLSISADIKENEREAAEAFMDYLLSEPGQDIINVRGGLALPLNKKMYQEYIRINGELEGAEGELSRIQILQEQ